MVAINKQFNLGEQGKIWQRYCGFLDLSLQDFMKIQEQLLLEEIDLVADSPLGKIIMKGNKPRSLTEFRQVVPLTTYQDYAPYFNEQREDMLAIKPCFWGRTSGKTGAPKWIPYTERAFKRLMDNTMGSFIFACANAKGEVNLRRGDKLVFNAAPRPYVSGFVVAELNPSLSLQPIPPAELFEKMTFEERLNKGFQMALRDGVDIVASISSVLVKIGESFQEHSSGMQFSRSLLHPAVLYRLARAWLVSKKEKRGILPKDLWRVKGIYCSGMDSSIYKDKIKYYWGKEPCETYSATEVPSATATQAWNKKWMNLIPYSAFYEFIPDEERLEAQKEGAQQPATVLLDQVEPGKCYELVITNFYGMPLMRYRMGDLIKIMALDDEEAEIHLPQIVFQTRVDGIIDIAGFTRLDEKTISQAIANANIECEDWSARKEYEQGEPILRLYIELKKKREVEDVRNRVEEQLQAIDEDYRHLVNMLGKHPMRINLVSKGTFQRYFREKEKAGADIGHLKPPHMCAADSVIADLLRLSESS
jgi:hypothetical protein